MKQQNSNNYVRMKRKVKQNPDYIQLKDISLFYKLENQFLTIFLDNGPVGSSSYVNQSVVKKANNENLPSGSLSRFSDTVSYAISLECGILHEDRASACSR